MPKPISEDLRSRAVAAYEAKKGTLKQIADRFGVAINSVSRWVIQKREHGHLSPKPYGTGSKPIIPDEELEKVQDLVHKKPDRSTEEYCAEWNSKNDNKVSRATMGRAILRAGLTCKKKTFRSEARYKEDVKAKEKDFLEQVQEIPPEKLVFLDETGINLGMTPTHARAPKGKRAYATQPPRGENFSLIGAMRSTGMCALYPYDGPVDGEKFLWFLEQKLIPTLEPGDVLVMDNLRVHHIKEVAELLDAAVARALYLPPYSPEKNPIEEAWSLTKQIFRKVEARTIPALVDAMNLARSAVTPEKIAGFFAHAGYPLTG